MNKKAIRGKDTGVKPPDGSAQNDTSERRGKTIIFFIVILFETHRYSTHNFNHYFVVVEGNRFKI